MNDKSGLSQPPTLRMPWRHMMLALAIVLVWGTNFTIAKIALAGLPPLLFTALRFFFTLFPAILFVRRPAVPWRMVARYGAMIQVTQFGLLYLTMEHSISPGLASLVIQVQVFVTIGLAMAFSGERVKGFQAVALLFIIAGMGLILAHAGSDATVGGVVLVLLSACGWAVGNHIARQSGKVDMLGYVVWGSLFSALPLFLLSFAFEGWPAIHAGLAQASVGVWACVIWQAVGNTLFGYSAWGWLLARYPAATVAPLSLLVPLFGFTTSALVLGEALPAWKMEAAALVICGLALNLLWPKLRGN